MQTVSGNISLAQVLSTINCYNKSLQSLQYSAQNRKSAVAIIIKKPSKLQQSKQKLTYETFMQDQILLLQRKASIKDRFSGQICFPGGRQQPNELLIDTAIRQTFQQTNILLKKQNLIGCIDKQVNFIIAQQNKHFFQQNKQKSAKQTFAKTQQKNLKQMVVYAFIFCIQQSQFDQKTIKLNKDQMQAYKWVKAMQFVKSSNAVWYDYTERLKSLVMVYHYISEIQEHSNQALKSINRALSPAFNVHMNEKVYGLTLYILMILFSNFTNKLSQQLRKNRSMYCKQKTNIIQNMIFHFNYIKVRCSDYFHFQLNNSVPINDSFRIFQSLLFSHMYRMRPKL